MSGLPRLERSQVPPIYAIADADGLGAGRLSAAVEAMVEAGITWIQVRAKLLGELALCEEIGRVMANCKGRFALWVNDRPDLASLYGSQGVHVGQADMPPSAARIVVGEECWIGRSTHNLEQLAEADRDPEVDLIALGPIFSTSSKENADPVVGLQTLREARLRTAKPLVAIGGLREANALEALCAGADSVVMLSALCRGDIGANCRRLQQLVRYRQEPS